MSSHINPLLPVPSPLSSQLWIHTHTHTRTLGLFLTCLYSRYCRHRLRYRHKHTQTCFSAFLLRLAQTHILSSHAHYIDLVAHRNSVTVLLSHIVTQSWSVTSLPQTQTHNPTPTSSHDSRCSSYPRLCCWPSAQTMWCVCFR